MFFLWYFIGSVKDVWLPVFFLSLVQKPAQSFFLIFWTDWCHSEEDQRSNCEGNKWVEKRAEIKLWTSCDLRWQMMLAVQQTSSHHIPVLFHLPFCRVFRYREWQDSYFSADCCLSKQCLPSLCWTETWHCLSLSLSCGSVIHFLFTVLGFISPSVMKKPFSHKQHCLTIKKKKNLSRWGEGRGSYPPLGQELGVHNFGLGRRRKKQDFMSG